MSGGQSSRVSTQEPHSFVGCRGRSGRKIAVFAVADLANVDVGRGLLLRCVVLSCAR